MALRKSFFINAPLDCFLATPFGDKIRGLFRRSEGSVVVYAALTLPVVAGLMGFGLDTSVWYAMKRDVRGMADAAAVAAAYSKMQGDTANEILAAATKEAVRNGYDSTDCATGPCLELTEVANSYGETTETIQVRVHQDAPLLFSNLFIDRVQVSAFASSGVASLGTQCVLALNETASGAITFTGNTSANVGCGVTANSNNAQALIVTGSAELTANPVQAHGGISLGGSGQITSDYPLLPFSASVPDPYASFVLPAMPSSCDFNNESTKVHKTSNYAASAPDQAVRFCNGLNIKGPANFAPGIYIIDGGELNFGAQANIDARGGVTFVLTGSSPSNMATWKFNAQAILRIEAPATDGHPTKGMAIVMDRDAPAGVDNKINGGSSQEIDGVIYFPSQKVTFTGGQSTVASCVQIIADTVDFKGNSYLENDVDVCEAVGVGTGGTGGGQQVVLVR